jgi:hypothetical protein
MLTNEQVQTMAGRDCGTVIAKEKKLNTLLRGRTARILSDYNGQPYGRSRKPMTGKDIEVAHVCLDRSGVTVLPKGERLYLHITDLRFV